MRPHPQEDYRKQRIERTDQRIDQSAVKLYSLTDKEIQIIEEATV